MIRWWTYDEDDVMILWWTYDDDENDDDYDDVTAKLWQQNKTKNENYTSIFWMILHYVAMRWWSYYDQDDVKHRTVPHAEWFKQVMYASKSSKQGM